MIIRTTASVLLALSCAASVFAQTDEDAPSPGLLRGRKLTSAEARDAVRQAQRDTVAQLRAMGGKFVQKASKLETLSPSTFLESMATAPPVGPSTIAPLKAGESAPTPSINTIKGNGATTAHPAVALLLAFDDDVEAYMPACTGTLIRQNVVLTAAHCMCYTYYPQDRPADGAQCVHGVPGVNGGADKASPPLSKPANWRVFFQHAGLRQVKQVVIDEQYAFGDNAIHDDLALLVLDAPVTEIEPAPMLTAVDAVATWGDGEIVGFGFSSVHGADGIDLTHLLQSGIKGVGRVTSGLCSSLSYLDPAASLCSTYGPGPGESGATICKGDSGGPLWQPAGAGTEVGVTSGISTKDCTKVSTIGFQMATAFRRHNDWISTQLQAIPNTPVKAILPAFGDNLKPVADRRPIGAFSDTGSYKSGPITSEAKNRILATMNSAGTIQSFSVVEEGGKVLCKGTGGPSAKLPNVNYCWANVDVGTKYTIVAKGEANQYVQYVVSTRAPSK